LQVHTHIVNSGCFPSVAVIATLNIRFWRRLDGNESTGPGAKP
jgi:hypothetical protein